MISAALLANVPVPWASAGVTAGELGPPELAFTTLVILGNGTSDDQGLCGDIDIEPELTAPEWTHRLDVFMPETVPERGISAATLESTGDTELFKRG